MGFRIQFLSLMESWNLTFHSDHEGGMLSGFFDLVVNANMQFQSSLDKWGSVKGKCMMDPMKVDDLVENFDGDMLRDDSIEEKRTLYENNDKLILWNILG